MDHHVDMELRSVLPVTVCARLTFRAHVMSLSADRARTPQDDPTYEGADAITEEDVAWAAAERQILLEVSPALVSAHIRAWIGTVRMAAALQCGSFRLHTVEIPIVSCAICAHCERILVC